MTIKFAGQTMPGDVRGQRQVSNKKQGAFVREGFRTHRWYIPRWYIPLYSVQDFTPYG
jgi:hypothetical protein